MADAYWKQIMGAAVEEALEAVEQTRKYVVEYVFPGLIEKQQPAERLAYYQTLDWEKVRELSPALWKLMTDDALNLLSREQQ